MSAYKSVNSTSAGGSRNRETWHVYVGGTGPEVEISALKEFFEQFAPVADCAHIKNKDGGSRGCCKVRFETEPSPELLKTVLSAKYRLNDKEWNIQPFNPNQKEVCRERQEENDRSVMLMNLHPDVTTQQLRQELEKQFGKVCKAEVLRDASGKSMLFGHATFATKEMATWVKDLAKIKIGGKNVKVNPKKDRNEIAKQKNSGKPLDSQDHSSFGDSMSQAGFPASNISAAGSKHSNGNSNHCSSKRGQEYSSPMALPQTCKVPGPFGMQNPQAGFQTYGRCAPSPHPEFFPNNHHDMYAGMTLADFGMDNYHVPQHCDMGLARSTPQPQHHPNAEPKRFAQQYPHGYHASNQPAFNTGASPFQPPRPQMMPNQPNQGHPWQMGANCHGPSMMAPHGPFAPPFNAYPGLPQVQNYALPQMSAKHMYPKTGPLPENKEMDSPPRSPFRSTGLESLHASGNSTHGSKFTKHFSDFPTTSNHTYGQHLQTTRELLERRESESYSGSQRPHTTNSQHLSGPQDWHENGGYFGYHGTQVTDKGLTKHKQMAEGSAGANQKKNDSSTDSIELLSRCIGQGKDKFPCVKAQGAAATQEASGKAGWCVFGGVKRCESKK